MAMVKIYHALEPFRFLRLSTKAATHRGLCCSTQSQQSGDPRDTERGVSQGGAIFVSLPHGNPWNSLLLFLKILKDILVDFGRSNYTVFIFTHEPQLMVNCWFAARWFGYLDPLVKGTATQGHP